jgi:hypothetical protein
MLIGYAFLKFNISLNNVRINGLQSMIFFKILLQLLFCRVKHMYREKFFTFSPITFHGELIILSLKMAFEF